MDDENVVYFTGETKLDISPTTILNAVAQECEYDNILIVGQDSEGSLHLHSSTGNKEKVVYMLESIKQAFLEQV